MRALFRIIICLTLVATTARAEDSDGEVWAALYLATNEAPSGEPSDIEETLATALPDWKSFEMLGENNQKILTEYESWVVPTKEVFLKIDSLGRDDSGKGLRLNLQLWQEKDVLVKTDTILRKAPLIIAGPEWGDGRLIMVVQLKAAK